MLAGAPPTAAAAAGGPAGGGSLECGGSSGAFSPFSPDIWSTTSDDANGRGGGDSEEADEDGCGRVG